MKKARVSWLGVAAATVAVGGAAPVAGQPWDAREQGIPPGHLPPPGECRIWHPGVPPGQQPPPFPCGHVSGYGPVGVITVGAPARGYGERARRFEERVREDDRRYEEWAREEAKRLAEWERERLQKDAEWRREREARWRERMREARRR